MMNPRRLPHRRTLALVFGAALAYGMSGLAGESAAQRDDWAEALEQLDPQRPLDYFLLAEEIADAAKDDSDLALARQLFSLAAVLDPLQLGQGACLGIADLVSSEAERRRLHALATLLAQRRGQPPLIIEDSVVAASLGTSPASLLGLSEAFSHFRRGHGTTALSVLRQSGALELVEANDALVPGGGHRFLEECRRYRNGEARPTLAEHEILDMLRLETALLAGDNRPWSGDLLLNDHAPLIEVDPDHLEESLAVDGRRTVYRNGRWIPAPR